MTKRRLGTSNVYHFVRTSKDMQVFSVVKQTVVILPEKIVHAEQHRSCDEWMFVVHFLK